MVSRTPTSMLVEVPVVIRTHEFASRVSGRQTRFSDEDHGGYWPLDHSRSQPPNWCTSWLEGQ
ncbi:hypothetical protein [Lysobacter antibioticus]|uniref:hypothetical protein n=1 Tax=Lysobacter antibioticus TaxID=84531 RepID=UPI0011409234|nr:hypothetical protein [Lysobacter antibioticus]